MEFSTQSASNTQAVVPVQWLASNHGKPGIKVIDATWDLINKQYALEVEKIRIPGAAFFDIDKICDPRSDPMLMPHMAAAPQLFEEKVQQLGVNDDDHIVLYDRSGAYVASARVWWNFRLYGHNKVSVLEGGLNNWIKHTNNNIETGPLNQQQRGNFKVKGVHPELLKTFEQMLQVVKQASTTPNIIDARPPGRFKGVDPEPRPNLRRGHLPNSVNIPHLALLAKQDPQDNFQVFLPRDQLSRIFREKGIDISAPVITSCGSGVNASIIALALHELGNTKYSVYDGSFTEWAKEDLTTPVIKDE